MNFLPSSWIIEEARLASVLIVQIAQMYHTSMPFEQIDWACKELCRQRAIHSKTTLGLLYGDLVMGIETELTRDFKRLLLSFQSPQQGGQPQ